MNKQENLNNKLSIEEIAKLPFWKSIKEQLKIGKQQAFLKQGFDPNLSYWGGLKEAWKRGRQQHKTKSKKEKIMEWIIGLLIVFLGVMWILYSRGII